jgi:hypothetical protein
MANSHRHYASQRMHAVSISVSLNETARPAAVNVQWPLEVQSRIDGWPATFHVLQFIVCQTKIHKSMIQMQTLCKKQ